MKYAYQHAATWMTSVGYAIFDLPELAALARDIFLHAKLDKLWASQTDKSLAPG